jgi:hypothetical protein
MSRLASIANFRYLQAAYAFLLFFFQLVLVQSFFSGVILATWKRGQGAGSNLGW